MKFNANEEFKPSDVIEGLNDFYRRVGERRRFEAKYGLSGAAGPFLYIKRRCGESLTTTFCNPHVVEDAITWLREECDIFYQPGLKWDDLKYKMPLKAAENEYGTTDIREMYPGCVLMKPRACGKTFWISSCPSFRDDEFHRMVEAERAAKKYSLKQFEKDLGIKHLDLPWELSRDEAEKVMNYCMNDVIATRELMREKERLDGKEALEGLRTLYYAVATRHERAMKRLDECLADDRDWPETSYMLEYIRKRVETAEYLCKENDDLRDRAANLKDLINHINEETDI